MSKTLKIILAISCLTIAFGAEASTDAIKLFGHSISKTLSNSHVASSEDHLLTRAKRAFRTPTFGPCAYFLWRTAPSHEIALRIYRHALRSRRPTVCGRRRHVFRRHLSHIPCHGHGFLCT